MQFVGSRTFLSQLDRRAVDMEIAGGEAVGRTARLFIGEIRQFLAEMDGELLSLDQAEKESGYTKEHLRKLVAQGVIPNRGRKGKPLIQRSELPRKPKSRSVGDYDAAEDVAQFYASKREVR
jgi:hypothetical protein